MWNIRDKWLRAALGAVLMAGMMAGAATVLPGVASAQTEARTAAHGDWSVFESGSGAGKICWIVTQPTAKVARRDGRVVEVERGQIYMMVAIRPGDGVRNEVSFLSGYPFRSGSKVRIVIGGTTFEMFTEGENAWLSSQEEDDALVAAMRRGATAMARGVSQRGTETEDTFSLTGFTAAIEQAKSLCGG